MFAVSQEMIEATTTTTTIKMSEASQVVDC
jgi:hypothetical protein